MGEASNIEKYINENTKLLWVETPTNPMMNVIDIEAVSKIAKANNLLLAVDNTFATPYLQQPLDLGADIVMHSATKYLGGHSDVVMGSLVVRDEDLADKLYFIQKASGAICGPQDSFLVLRGIKTLHLRIQRHCENGETVAKFLRSHPKIGKVYWPGFEDHPNHDIAKKQMKGFGGMMSFELRGGLDFDLFQKKLKLIKSSMSLAGVESTILSPSKTSHGLLSPEEREAQGIKDGLMRFSLGIEEKEDLMEDLEQALKEIRG